VSVIRSPLPLIRAFPPPVNSPSPFVLLEVFVWEIFLFFSQPTQPHSGIKDNKQSPPMPPRVKTTAPSSPVSCNDQPLSCQPPVIAFFREANDDFFFFPMIYFLRCALRPSPPTGATPLCSRSGEWATLFTTPFRERSMLFDRSVSNCAVIQPLYLGRDRPDEGPPCETSLFWLIPM